MTALSDWNVVSDAGLVCPAPGDRAALARISDRYGGAAPQPGSLRDAAAGRTGPMIPMVALFVGDGPPIQRTHEPRTPDQRRRLGKLLLKKCLNERAVLFLPTSATHPGPAITETGKGTTR